jgi:transposase
MEHYVGLTVSLKMTAICIVDRAGKIEREGVVASDPEAIAAFVRLHAPHIVRIGLETGATSTWLWTELNKMGASGYLHRCPARESGSEDADQQERP